MARRYPLILPIRRVKYRLAAIAPTLWFRYHRLPGMIRATPRGFRVAVRKPYKEAARAMSGSAAEQIDFIAMYRPDLIAGMISETSSGIYVSRKALKAAVMQTYAHLCKTSPKAMKLG